MKIQALLFIFCTTFLGSAIDIKAQKSENKDRDS